jgi:hypothetical protein
MASIGAFWLPKPVVAQEEVEADIEDVLGMPYLEPLPNETLYEYALRKTEMMTHDMQMLMHLKHGCPERLCRFRHIPEHIQYNNSILYTYFRLRRGQLANITAEERQEFFERLPGHVRGKWKEEAQYIGSLRKRTFGHERPPIGIPRSFLPTAPVIPPDHRFVPMEAERLGCKCLKVPVPHRDTIPEGDVDDCVHRPYGDGHVCGLVHMRSQIVTQNT